MCEVVAVAGVLALDDEGRLLLVRRRSDGTWTHPAGRVEAGESWAQAARREFAEETGGDVHLEDVLGVYSDPATQTYTYPSGRRVQFVGVAFRGIVVSLGVHEADEILEVGWFGHSALPVDIFAPARPIIQDAFAPTGIVVG